MDQNPPVSPNDRALAFLRIGVGCLFLIFAEYKVAEGPSVWSAAFTGWIERFLAEGAYPAMRPILHGFVLPHSAGLSWLVAYGELALGLSLVLGVWVRLASVWGTVYMLALLFSSNYPGPHAAPWQYFGASLDHLVLALCFVAFVVGRPARVLSLEHALRQAADHRRTGVA